jgi:Ni/Co efflux regulator RcnB
MNGRSITTCALALAFLAVSGRAALAQNRGQDHGRGNGQNQGQNDANWNRDHHTTFNNQDRQVTRDWYQQHQQSLGRGWRQQDHLSPGMQSRLRPGQQLDPQLRRQMYWLPADLSRRYAPAPRGFRYAVIGGNIVMLDGNYHVYDVFAINLRF